MLESLDGLLGLALGAESLAQKKSGPAGGRVDGVGFCESVSRSREVLQLESVHALLHPHLRNEFLRPFGNLGILIFSGDLLDLRKLRLSLLVLLVLDQILGDLKSHTRDGVLAVRHELIGVGANRLTHFESLLEIVESLGPILHRDGCGSIIVEFGSLSHVLGGHHACGHKRGRDRENKLFHCIKNLCLTIFHNDGSNHKCNKNLCQMHIIGYFCFNRR